MVQRAGRCGKKNPKQCHQVGGDRVVKVKRSTLHSKGVVRGLDVHKMTNKYINLADRKKGGQCRTNTKGRVVQGWHGAGDNKRTVYELVRSRNDLYQLDAGRR